VLAQRDPSSPVIRQPRPITSQAPAVASRMACPACGNTLQWTSHEASCTACDQRYTQTDGVWNFVVTA
jgi:predicted RNA-binding Zn-ribbon protein involved in translation (DUF1610 family)